MLLRCKVDSKVSIYEMHALIVENAHTLRAVVEEYRDILIEVDDAHYLAFEAYSSGRIDVINCKAYYDDE